MPHSNKGGRPAKFAAPSRVVTLTLPESTLEQLHRFDQDRSSAIVHVVNQFLSRYIDPPQVEVVPVGPRHGLIVTAFCRVYEAIPFVKLVEVEPGRFLIALDQPYQFTDLELAVNDLLADHPNEISGPDRVLMDTLLTTIRQLRKTNRVRKAEILLVDLGTSLPTPLQAPLST